MAQPPTGGGLPPPPAAPGAGGQPTIKAPKVTPQPKMPQPPGSSQPAVTIKPPQKQGPIDNLPFGYVPPNRQYDGYKPLAPSDFPSPYVGGEYKVDEEMVKDKAHTSMPLVGLALFWLAALIGLIVILALIAQCKIKAGSGQMCDSILDVSSNPGFYSFDTFEFNVPTVYIWASMTAGVFGLFVICLYAISVIRQDVGTPRMVEIATYIREGAVTFLLQELIPMSILILALFLLVGLGVNWRMGGCYAIGALLSYVTGFCGMMIATRGNVRTACAAEQGMSKGLNVAFRTGAVMGLSVVSIGITGLSVVYFIFRDVRALAGYSAGASTIALFARVGGGIYTKAADVGADLVGKVESNIPEDDPRNPATIADNVGDNVGDVAGMGADLFESYVGSIVAACILAAGLPYFQGNRFALCVYQHLIIDETCGSPAEPPFEVSIANTICSLPATQFNSTAPLYTFYPNLGWNQSIPMFIAFPFMMAMVGVIVGVICTIYVWVPKSANASTKGKADVIESLLWSLRINVMISSVLIIAGAAGLSFGFFGNDSSFSLARGMLDKNLPTFKLDSTLAQPCTPGAGGSLPVLLPVQDYYRPFDSLGFDYPSSNEIQWRLFIAILIGMYLGMIIGYLTEFFTAGSYSPTQGIGASGEYGAGAVVIQGLGVGMLSTVLPLALVVAVIIGAYNLLGSYTIGLAAVGMLSTLGITMATDAYGPVADNAGGIAEMAGMPSTVRDTTDALDALGNTTAATGKGFSNGSAILTAYALVTALVQDSGLSPPPRALVGAPGIQPQSLVFDRDEINLVDIYVVVSLLIGIMLPFLFGALTMLAVSRAAQAMIVEVRRQFREIRGLREGASGVRPEHIKCIQIAAQAAIFEMLLPGAAAITSPLIIGFGFGQRALVGLLLGAIGSGYMLGILMSNAGGAWDNAKKLVESGYFGKKNAKGSEWHKATVAGDTVGDPFKDTSGPSMNILIKLMSVFGLIAVPYMHPGTENGWIGAIILVITLLICGVFAFWWYRRTSELQKLAREKPKDPKPREIPAISAKSPYYIDGAGFEIDRINPTSALAEAYELSGGERGVKGGDIKDPFNMPGLYNGTEDWVPPGEKGGEYIPQDAVPQDAGAPKQP